MNDSPSARELFMGLWYGASNTSRGPRDIVYWAKAWIECVELAKRLEEMEAKAAHAEAADVLTPTSWPPGV